MLALLALLALCKIVWNLEVGIGNVRLQKNPYARLHSLQGMGIMSGR